METNNANVAPATLTPGKFGLTKYKLVTPYGTFRRETSRPYQFVVVSIWANVDGSVGTANWTSTLEAALEKQSKDSNRSIVYNLSGIQVA